MSEVVNYLFRMHRKTNGSVFRNLLNYNILLKVSIVTLKGTLKHAKMSVKEC
jgi:hypothetical protein